LSAPTQALLVFYHGQWRSGGKQTLPPIVNRRVINVNGNAEALGDTGRF